jgi:hypothetical protein
MQKTKVKKTKIYNFYPKYKSGLIFAVAISTLAIIPNSAMSEEIVAEEPINLETSTGNRWFNNETGIQLGLATSYGKKGDEKIIRGDIAFGYSFGKVTPYGEASYLELDGDKHDGHATMGTLGVYGNLSDEYGLSSFFSYSRGRVYLGGKIETIEGGRLGIVKSVPYLPGFNLSLYGSRYHIPGSSGDNNLEAGFMISYSLGNNSPIPANVTGRFDGNSNKTNTIELILGNENITYAAGNEAFGEYLERDDVQQPQVPQQVAPPPSEPSF